MGPKLNDITEPAIGAAITVHKALGPGLLESVYEACLSYELNSKWVKFRETEGFTPQLPGSASGLWVSN